MNTTGGATVMGSYPFPRNGIVELDYEFILIFKKPGRAPKVSKTIKEQSSLHVNWDEEIRTLPYIFSDPVQFDKKVGPHNLKFGSKMRVEDAQQPVRREAYMTVKRILAPNLIELNNHTIVRLLGVKPKADKVEEALTFLTKRIFKRQVYLKYDDIRYDQEGHTLAYVYLKDKTFINAHLVKKGFADVDTEYPFQHQTKFEKLYQENVHHENES